MVSTQWEPFKGSPRGSQQRALSFRDDSSNSERAKHHFASVCCACTGACASACTCVATPSGPQSGNFTKSRENKRKKTGRDLKKRAARQIPVFQEKLYSNGVEGEVGGAAEMNSESAQKNEAHQEEISERWRESSQKRFKRGLSILTLFLHSEEVFTILFSLYEPLTWMKMDEMSQLPAFVLRAQSEQWQPGSRPNPRGGVWLSVQSFFIGFQALHVRQHNDALGERAHG